MDAIKDEGECSLGALDDANIPVNIWLRKDEDSGLWELTASNFMPRKGHITEDAYRVTCATREPLAGIVRDKFLPLYRTAVARLTDMVYANQESLYYWSTT